MRSRLIPKWAFCLIGLAWASAQSAVLAPDRLDEDQISGWYLGFDGRMPEPIVTPFMKARQIDGAVRKLLDEREDAARAAPEDPVAQARLADMYLRVNRLDEAAQAYWRAARLDPENPDVLESFGFVLLALGDPENGLAVYRRLQAAKKDGPRIRFNIAAALAQLGRHDEAAVLWQAYLIEDDSAEPRAAYNLALSHLHAGRPRDAIRLLELLVHHQPDQPYFLAGLIRALKSVSAPAESIGPFEERLKSLVGSDQARRLTAEIPLPVFLIR